MSPLVHFGFMECFGVWVVNAMLILGLIYWIWLLRCDLKYYINRTHELSQRLERVTNTENMERLERILRRTATKVEHHDD
jgi:hypothetical protein